MSVSARARYKYMYLSAIVYKIKNTADSHFSGT